MKMLISRVFHCHFAAEALKIDPGGAVVNKGLLKWFECKSCSMIHRQI